MSNDKLQLIIDQQGIDKTDVQKLVEAFGGPFKESGDILNTYKEIKVTDIKDIAGMNKAREFRLQLKKSRTTVENKRKELKADIVKQGRAIDSVARYVKEEIEPAEQYLQEQEDYAKNVLIKEAAELKSRRIEKLSKYVEDVTLFNLDGMTEEQFSVLLGGAKTAHEEKIEEARKAEEDRVAKELAEREENERIRKENEKLRIEADKKEKEHEQERRVEAEKQAKIKEEAKKKQEAVEAELRKEREKAKAIEDERLEREAEARRIEEARKAKEAEDLLAPDKEKLLNLSRGLDLVRTQKLPAVKTKQAQDVIQYIEDGLKKLSEYLVDKSKELGS